MCLIKIINFEQLSTTRSALPRNVPIVLPGDPGVKISYPSSINKWAPISLATLFINVDLPAHRTVLLSNIIVPSEISSWILKDVLTIFLSFSAYENVPEPFFVSDGYANTLGMLK